MRKTLAILLLLLLAGKGYCANSGHTNFVSRMQASAIVAQEDATIDFNVVADDDQPTIFDDKDDDDNDFSESSYVAPFFFLVSLQPVDAVIQSHSDCHSPLTASGVDLLVKHSVFRI